jgi:DNA-binding response OmpR family regulator
MSKESILVIEDDPDIRELLQYNLEREGFHVQTAADGEQGVATATEKPPHLILLDIMLPGIDGLEVCRRLKQADETQDVPIIIITAKGEESDVVVGLSMGADDYVAKPFKVKVVVARIRAVLRRGAQSGNAKKEATLERGPLKLDPERYEVFLDGELVALTLTEFRLCQALASQPGRVYTRDHLIDKITGGDGFISDRNVDVHVRSLRKKFGEHAELIVTIRGVGYKWKD